ncbi:MAG: glycosyltransferase family 4 protein [Acetobacteraceae bacterium]|nr:glycosyltransferase family 4 protein [Acetobacteraceae bacterium]
MSLFATRQSQGKRRFGIFLAVPLTAALFRPMSGFDTPETWPISAPTSSEPIRVIMLPPLPWQPERLRNRLGNGPDRDTLDRLFAKNGVEIVNIDPCRRPWNPFAGAHSLLQGLDPLRALRVLLFERDCDAIWACCESPSLILLLLRRVLRFRKPVVAVDVGFDVGWRLRRWVMALLMPRLDGLITLANTHVDLARSRWRTTAKVVFIHQHVDTDFYSPAPFAPNGPVLAVGDDIGRDFPTLLKAVEGLDLDLVIRTRRALPELPSHPRIKVMSDRLPWPDYRGLFEQARFVAIPLSASIHASGVGSILEAMATGRALVVSNSPGIADYIEHEKTALVVPCGDAAAFRAAVERLQQDDELCQRLGAAGRAFVERHCAYSVHASRTATWLRQLVAQHRQGFGDLTGG